MLIVNPQFCSEKSVHNFFKYKMNEKENEALKSRESVPLTSNYKSSNGDSFIINNSS
jgi:hypothetical protein